jgi:hypothetical protein
MITKITYKDKRNWTKEVTGDVTDWANYSEKYINDRVQPFYVKPIVVTDIWNGKEYDVQHILHTSHYLEFYIQEDGNSFLRDLNSCSDIVITNITENSDGEVLVEQFNDIDLIKSSLFEISEPERINFTSSWKVSIIFRTGRTVVNKALPIDNTNNIRFQTNIWKLDQSNSILSSKSITKLTDNTVAVSGGGDIITYELVNSTWQQVGNIKLTGGIISDLTALTSTDVAFINDSGNLEKYNFNGTNWTKVGNTLALGALTAPRITSLTDTRIALYDSSLGEIRAYDFDGTNWSLIGSGLSITAGNADIVALSSSKIGLLDPTSSELRDYDFSGSLWTVNDIIATSVSGTVCITKIDTNRVAISSSGNDELESYVLDSTWSLENGGITLINSDGVVESIQDNIVYLNSDNSGVYSYGIYYYYSDYEVFNWNKPVSDIDIEWFDGSIKKAQRTNKNGIRYLQYILISDHNKFIENLKASNEIQINNTIIKEVEFSEPVIIGEGLMKIEIKGVTDVTTTTNYQNSNKTYSILVNGNTYYTDFQTEQISEPPEITTQSNKTGISSSSKSITKILKQMKFFLSESDAFSLKDDFELYGQSAVINPGAENVLENREVTPERLGYNLYQVDVNCLISAKVN